MVQDHRNNPSDKVDKHDRGDDPEKRSARAWGEAGNGLGSLGQKIKQLRNQQHESGNSGVTGKGDAKNGTFKAAKDILGDAVHMPLIKEAEAKRDAEFRKKHGDPDELQGDRKAKGSSPAHNPVVAPQHQRSPMEIARDAIKPISESFSRAASWEGPKNAIDHMMQVADVIPEAHREQKQGTAQTLSDAGDEFGSIFSSAAKTIDQIGQHMHPRAIARDSHETAEVARHGLQSAGTYFGDKFGRNELGSIAIDAWGTFNEGLGKLIKATVDRNNMTPIERGHLPGAVAAVVGTGRIGEIIHAEEPGTPRDLLHMPEVPENLKHLELQKASPDLLNRIVDKGVPIRLAETPEDLAHLKSVAASATYRMFDDGTHEIVLPKNPAKIQALEEFLHSTQKKIGLLDQLEPAMAEVHVKHFILRHPKLLGLSEDDITVMKALKEKAVKRLADSGYTFKEN